MKEKKLWACVNYDGYQVLMEQIEKPIRNSRGEFKIGTGQHIFAGKKGYARLLDIACGGVKCGQCRVVHDIGMKDGTVMYVAEPLTLEEAAIRWREACWTPEDVARYRASKLSTLQIAIDLVDAIDRLIESRQSSGSDCQTAGNQPHLVEHSQLGS